LHADFYKWYAKKGKSGTNGSNYLIRKDSDYLAQNEEKGNKIWRLHKKSLSLQRESNRFTIQVSFLRGQAVYVTTHFIKAVQQSVRLCFLSKTIHHHFQEAFTQSNIAFNRYLSITTIYQYFLNICGYFKIVSDFLCQSTNAVIRLKI